METLQCGKLLDGGVKRQWYCRGAWTVGGCFLVTVMLVVERPVANAANISWGTPFSITSASDIDTTGTLVEAVNFTDPADTGGPYTVDTGLEMIAFVDRYGDDASLSGTNYPYNDSRSSSLWTTDTGDAGLNEILLGQVWTGTDGTNSLVSVTLSGLTIGGSYQLQIIGPADERSCCSDRTLQADDSTVDGTPGNLSAVMARGDAPSVIGTFVADAMTQSFSIRGADPTPDDPAIDGYVLRLVPEPSSVALAMLALAMVAGMGSQRRG